MLEIDRLLTLNILSYTPKYNKCRLRVNLGGIYCIMICVYLLSYSNECITTPERSFGSNHVVFGGIIFPESAMSISCFIETG